MKYIRTKDGIITNRLSDCNCFKSRGTTGRYILKSLEDDKDLELWLKYHRTNIFKQADTIKDLCDELVIHNPDNDGYFYSKTFVYKGDWEIMLKPMSDYEKSKGVEIYGAIWVFDDNGAPTLKPVAKMNENGDLELL